MSNNTSIIGICGSIGTQGLIGAQGSIGTKGLIGAHGSIGATGSVGYPRIYDRLERRYDEKISTFQY